MGAGAGAAIAAAFGAPLAGAFYAFEIVIGSYTVANIAPVVAAALAGSLVASLAHFEPLVVRLPAGDALQPSHYLLFAGLGMVCAGFGVLVMRLVGWTEMLTGRLPLPRQARTS